ncbi:MAG: DUF1934 family protein [Bacilli bacterium]
MSKIKLCTELVNKTENEVFKTETNGIIESNKIKYNDNGITVVITLNTDKIIINRRSEEYDIILPLTLNEKQNGEYKVKQLGTLNLEVVTKKLEINEKKIEIEYSMILDKTSKTDFFYKIEYEKEN